LTDGELIKSCMTAATEEICPEKVELIKTLIFRQKHLLVESSTLEATSNVSLETRPKA
jgi:hypothetical protein